MPLYYKITAINELGEGAPVTGSFTPATPPPAPRAVRSVTANASASADDDILIVTPSSADITISLLTATAYARPLTIKNASSSTHKVIVDPNASETVDSYTSVELAAGDKMTIVPNGTSWESI